eukprot:jgi/Ulvmu1/4364/UM002_0089.1
MLAGTAQAPTGLGNAFVAVTDLFMHWDRPHEAEPVRHVEDVVQLLSKTAATVCHATAGLGQSLGEDVLRSLSSISMAALAVKDQRWQLPSASDQLVTSLLEHGKIHITRQLLQRLDTCAPVVATSLRTALQLRLQGAMSAEENSKPNERSSCTIVAILTAAQLEHDMPSLLLVATPNLVQCCAEHKSAAVRKAACTCIRVMVQYACHLMAANETKQVEQILHWSAAGLAKRLAQDRDCTVRIHACHEVRDVLSRTTRDGVCRNEVAHRLLMHLGRAAAGTGNKRVLVAASKDLTVLADAQQAAHINDSEVRGFLNNFGVISQVAGKSPMGCVDSGSGCHPQKHAGLDTRIAGSFGTFYDWYCICFRPCHQHCRQEGADGSSLEGCTEAFKRHQPMCPRTG